MPALKYMLFCWPEDEGSLKEKRKVCFSARIRHIERKKHDPIGKRVKALSKILFFHKNLSLIECFPVNWQLITDH